eukprot:04187.XXX_136023_107040_1 [CDS] Oithona nana genome sequencing.
MAKTEEKSIKYCARKCHNGGPLTKMMAAAAATAKAAKAASAAASTASATPNHHTKKFCSRTIVVAILLQLLRHFRSLVVTSYLLMIKPHIKSLSGAQMSLSPHLTYRLLLMVLTLQSSVSAKSRYKDDEVTGGLQCYIDVEAKTIVTCNELEGFKTCFIKYNDSKYIPSAFPFGVLHQYQEAAVVGRGCSTKDKVFYKECETHNYGDSLEKMCFCSFHLCNTSNQLNCPSFWTLTLLVFLLATLTQSCWDPWPSLSFRTLIISDATPHITKLRPDHLLTLAINSSDTISVRKKFKTLKHDTKDFTTISRKSDNKIQSDQKAECHHHLHHYQSHCRVAYKRR